MRIVTRPDFDGVVCAMLLCLANDIEEPVQWVEPSVMQHNLFEVREDDIIANLPFNEKCALWFDHHYTNRTDKPFEGEFREAPSAAGIVYDYYKDRIEDDYGELIEAVDRIDSADLTLDEVLRPEDHPYVLLSMTVAGHELDEAYWNRLVGLLRHNDVNTIVKDPEVGKRCEAAVERNREYRELLTKHTRMSGHVSVTDFRSLHPSPSGNRYLVYVLFPDSIVNMKIQHGKKEKEITKVSVGHSIFNRKCRVNVGYLLSGFGGGGHRGAGSCAFGAEEAPGNIASILGALEANKSNEHDGRTGSSDKKNENS